MVNKKLKKCASLFLVMSMAVSMFAGCGSKTKQRKFRLQQRILEKQQKRLQQMILQNQHRMSLAR